MEPEGGDWAEVTATRDPEVLKVKVVRERGQPRALAASGQPETRAPSLKRSESDRHSGCHDENLSHDHTYCQ
jgi:hypothetical protein